MTQSRDCLSSLVGELGMARTGLQEQASHHKYWIGFSMREKTPSLVLMCMWLWVCVFLCRGCAGILIPVLIDKCSATQQRLGLFSEGKGGEVAGGTALSNTSGASLSVKGVFIRRFCIICTSAVSLLAGSREYYPEDQAAAVSGAAGFWPASPREKRPKGVPAVWWDPAQAGSSATSTNFLCQPQHGAGCTGHLITQVRVPSGQAVTEFFPCFRGRRDYFCSNLPLWERHPGEVCLHQAKSYRGRWKLISLQRYMAELWQQLLQKKVT